MGFGRPTAASAHREGVDIVKQLHLEGYSMTPEMKSLYRFGAISFIGSGSLFLIKSVLEWWIGPPPSNGLEILLWSASAQLLLAMTNEVFFFAVMLLVPAVIALYASIAPTHRVHAIV